MYLTPEELKTHLYGENMESITRGDDTLVICAIDGAIQEAKGYLSAYDKDKIFAAEGDTRNQLLLIFIKDIAVWHLITLCNCGADLALRENRYNRAVDWLRAVKKEEVRPDLPAADNDNDGRPDGVDRVIFGSNPKRTQHY